MEILQSRSFKKKVNKLNETEKKALDNQILKIVENPFIGVEKKGDLRGICVHKFKLKTIQYLLSYRYSGEDLELIMIGTNEEYYRDLTNYLKAK